MPFSLKGRRSIIILTVLVFVHLILISIQVPLGAEQTLLKRVLFTVFSPFQRGIVAVFRSASSTWKDYFHLRGVRSENQKLKKEVFFLRQENKILQDLARFSRGEKKMKGDLGLIGKSVLAARIIGLDASNYFRSIIINKGSMDGVGTNMAVCDRHGNLVGRTVDPIAFKESRVQLITDGDSGVSVISTGPDRIVGILSGESQGMCRMKFVPATAKGGTEGETLITTGFDKIFPPGINVGTIIRVAQDNTLFKVILVDPSFRFNDLDQVAVFNQSFQELF